MKKDPNIQDELREIAPILSNLERKNPFRVPENYFQTNAQIAADFVQDKEPQLDLLRNISKDYLKVPKAYFETNADVWSKVIQDQEPALQNLQNTELQKGKAYFKLPKAYFEENAAVLAQVIKGNGEYADPVLSSLKGVSKDYLKVPKDYFEGLNARVTESVQDMTEAENKLQLLNDKDAMSVPPGYFQDFSNRLSQRIKEEESEQSALLEGMRSETLPFQVPQNYFEELPERILNRIRQEESKASSNTSDTNDINVEAGRPAPKVIQMENRMEDAPQRPNRVRQIGRALTAAAAVLAFVLLGTFLLRGPFSTDGSNPSQKDPVLVASIDPKLELEKKLSKLSDTELLEMIKAEDLDEFSLIENFDGEADIFTLTKDSEMELIMKYLESDNQLLKGYL